MTVRALSAALAAGLIALGLSLPAQAQEKLRVGWCSKTYNASMAPFAVALKKGWFKDNKVDFDLFSFAGSTDCMRNVATGELTLAMLSPEPLGIVSLQGVKAKVFFESYRRNIFGLAVAADSDIKSYADLKGQSVGVLSMGSVGVVIARSVVAAAGLNPSTDIRIVVTGEPAQTATLMRRGEVKALSLFDTYYTLVERAGVKLRHLHDPAIEKFPSNSWVALDETIEKRRADLVGFARAYAMGTAYAIAHPREAIKMVYEVYPQTKPTNMELEEAVTYDMPILQDRIDTWHLDNPATDKWGAVDVAAFQTYMDWLQKWGLLPGKVDAATITTNDLIADINAFDRKAIEKP
ncbi:ABC transporter substrate-binding protein [Aquabacter sp. CN5-332]|uniref:ABC transporter substrate-binding protein n=1 Tax=Aquabacter sp. CN5-332 TaxID=3156608 RepID=UPI0032B3C1CE